MIKNALLIPALVVTVVGASLWASTQTFAQDKMVTNMVIEPHTALVQKIADRFNLNKDEVQKVFDEERAAHKGEMEQRLENKLSQLVTDGKLTEEQKTKVLKKLQEEHANREANMEKMKSMTPEERKAAMKSHMDEMKQWAEENGINLQDIMIGHVSGHKDGMKIKMELR